MRKGNDANQSSKADNTKELAPMGWLIDDLCTTILDVSPEELPNLHNKLTALAEAIVDRAENTDAKLDQSDLQAPSIQQEIERILEDPLNIQHAKECDILEYTHLMTRELTKLFHSYAEERVNEELEKLLDIDRYLTSELGDSRIITVRTRIAELNGEDKE